MDWDCQFKIVAFGIWTLHYIKRLFENVFVHIHGPEKRLALIDIIVNCSYYHGFALWISHSVNSPFSCPQLDVGSYLIIGSWAVFQYANYSCHMVLREQKLAFLGKIVPLPSSKYLFSKAFDWVVCPNYLFEVLGWVAFALLVNSVPAWIFAFVGFSVMTFWAKEKHSNYAEKFPESLSGRKAIIPYILWSVINKIISFTHESWPCILQLEIK